MVISSFTTFKKDIIDLYFYPMNFLDYFQQCSPSKMIYICRRLSRSILFTYAFSFEIAVHKSNSCVQYSTFGHSLILRQFKILTHSLNTSHFECTYFKAHSNLLLTLKYDLNVMQRQSTINQHAPESLNLVLINIIFVWII